MQHDQIAGGSNEVQKNIVARLVLSLSATAWRGRQDP